MPYEVDSTFIKILIKENGLNLQYIINQDLDLCLTAIEQNPMALEFVKDQYQIHSKTAVEKNGLALKFVREQTDFICMLAVEQNGLALKYVKNKTIDICKAALKQNSIADKYINYNMKSKIFMNYRYLPPILSKYLELPDNTYISEPELITKIGFKFYKAGLDKENTITLDKETAYFLDKEEGLKISYSYLESFVDSFF